MRSSVFPSQPPLNPLRCASPLHLPPQIAIRPRPALLQSVPRLALPPPLPHPKKSSRRPSHRYVGSAAVSRLWLRPTVAIATTIHQRRLNPSSRAASSVVQRSTRRRAARRSAAPASDFARPLEVLLAQTSQPPVQRQSPSLWLSEHSLARWPERFWLPVLRSRVAARFRAPVSVTVSLPSPFSVTLSSTDERLRSTASMLRKRKLGRLHSSQTYSSSLPLSRG